MSVESLRLAMAETPAPSQTAVYAGLATVIQAAGDFTGGAAEDMFTLTAHGLVDGDNVKLLYESAAGVVTGAVGDVFVVKELSSSTFQLTTDGETVVENSADGTAVFSKAISSVSMTNAEAVTDPDDDGGWIEFV